MEEKAKNHFGRWAVLCCAVRACLGELRQERSGDESGGAEKRGRSQQRWEVLVQVGQIS
jgi:hypothetical protein